ncbi:DUF3888 domain-containing protein [Metabacillus fastidiosus]|uniref:DUF3888 domain-containing protein n=1 Tax=Metabacillus fastidiosus TaxID=1458 RepID=UPI003AF043D9
MGGAYEITVKVYPYYGAHNSYGIDEIMIRISDRNELIKFKHLARLKSVVDNLIYRNLCSVIGLTI